MREINVATAERYLRETNRIGHNEHVRIREISGGVSNVVLYVARDGHADFVLKQARGQLRVPEPWYCAVERIVCEVKTLRLCQKAIDAGRQVNRSGLSIGVPEILFEDRDNFAFAMSAAPPHQVWKEQLLAGQTDNAVAESCGELLATIHGQTWQDKEVAKQLDDTTYFHDLRIDPYYKQIARVHRQLESPIQRLIESLQTHRRCLVHGDFSPKNLLVHDTGVILVDCEVGHFGDPAFDLGFFLSHLTLKAFHGAPRFDSYLAIIENFWRRYRAEMLVQITQVEWRELESRAMDNLAACVLARIDGKSQIDYLDETRRDLVRKLVLPLFAKESQSFAECLATIARYLNDHLRDLST